MSDRYFVETPLVEGRALLRGAEAHHLIHVMRATPGTRVTLFDGSGVEFSARVEKVGRSEVKLAVLSRRPIDRELPLELTVAVALPKGDRQRWLVEKAVELGVGRLVPLRTVRSVAQPAEQALARLRRTVIEASKQCGRNRLMEICAAKEWADFVSDTRDQPCRIMAHPHGGRQRSDPLAAARLSSGVLLAVGPEGGFSGEEVSAAVAGGWQTIDLGPRVLRVETAALLLVAMVATRGEG